MTVYTKLFTPSLFKEIDTAIESFYTYIEIHNYIAEDKDIYCAINDDATFWQINLYGLQTAFFITLGRIFDDGSDTFSIHKLLNETAKHPEFFSKAALSARKIAGGVKPDWLDDYLSDLIDPQISDLCVFQKRLAKHRSNYDATYAAIRNKVFAHKIATNQSEVDAMFSNTLISDIENMLN